MLTSRFKKFRWINLWAVCFVFLLVIGWVFSGWPQIWQNPSIPPEIKKVKANPAEYLINPSFTGGTTDWTLDVIIYNSTTYQDTAGSIETASIGRNNEENGFCTQTLSVSIGSSDTVNLSLYWQKTWTAVASAKQDLMVQIKKPSMGDWTTPTTIYSETTVYESSGWVSVGPTDVSSYFDETGIYEIRFYINPRNGNNASAETHIWVDNTSLDVISGGALTVDIVDSGGSPVVSPSIIMNAATFSFNYQSATGTLGISTEKIRVENTTGAAQWSLTIAADNGSTAFWDGTVSDYDFNDPTASAGDGADDDIIGGQMTIDASGGTLGGTCSATDITKGSSTSFSEGVTDSITLLTAGASADTGCYWDFTNINISQTIPAEQSVDNLSINMTLTVTAS